jgi:hypothetical protein
MTELISLQIVGDCWNSPTEFQNQINQHPPGAPLEIDLRNEAPCLGKLGVTDVLNTWIKNRQISPDQVHLHRWANTVEYVPYRKIRPSSDTPISHFFHMVKNYWQPGEPSLEKQLQYHQTFGLFIGRLTISRAVILYQSAVLHNNIFISKMKHSMPLPWYHEVEQKNLENLSEWVSLREQADIFSWYNNNPIPSIDDKSVTDQFVTPISYIDTNTSLLQHYHKFAVEIVCETFTLGETFFPTEKTMRPIMSAKPMIVFGPRYHLARLRSMGFQTYHTIWDESYDLYEGPERWHHMKKSMRTLIECGRSDQHRILAQAHEIAMFNRQRLWDIWNHRADLTNHDYSKI